jgi:hypothetical protein
MRCVSDDGDRPVMPPIEEGSIDDVVSDQPIDGRPIDQVGDG